MDETSSFGYWVRRRRKALDLTQDELAQHVGCAAVTLRKIEADERRPSMQMARRLAQCLGLSDDEYAAFLAAAAGQQATSRLPRPAGSVAAPGIGNLPAPVTTLVGRSGEIDAIAGILRLGEARLVTLTGPVGVGKTRLALEVGRRLSGQYRDGVFLVALASVQDPSLVASATATVLGVRESRDCDVARSVANFLAKKQMLLIFDNLEHLLPAAAFLSTLLADGPHLQLMVTSRARLYLYGEYEFAIPPLALPDPSDPMIGADTPAVRLFCDRARAARADFRLTPSLTPAVAEICRRLDGLPLAIELAAARINLFSIQELLKRLERRLPLLCTAGYIGGAGGTLPRSQGLASAIAWSYGLLTPAERGIMSRLAVFAGGFSLSTAEEICAFSPLAPPQPSGAQPLASIAEVVGTLLEQSLLIRRPDSCESHLSAQKECLHCPARQLHEATNAESRYSMFEIIREFVLEQLQANGEMETVQQRHADYFAAWAQQAEPQFYGREQALWLARMEQETDNLRAALNWLLANKQIAAAGAMACALATFWQRHGHYSEGRWRLEGILAQLHEIPVDRPLRARCLQRAATLAYRQGDWQAAQGWLAESLRIYREDGNRSGAARAIFDLGWIALDRRQWAEAATLNQKSLSIAREAGEPEAVYRALTNLGWAKLGSGGRDAAAALFLEARQVAQSIGHIKGEAVSLTNLGWVSLCENNPAEAAPLISKSVHLCRLMGEREVLAENLEILSATAMAEGDADRAAKLGGAAEALWEALHVLRPPVEFVASAQTQVTAAAQSRLGVPGFEAAWRQGRAMSIDAMVALALRCDTALAEVK